MNPGVRGSATFGNNVGCQKPKGSIALEAQMAHCNRTNRSAKTRLELVRIYIYIHLYRIVSAVRLLNTNDLITHGHIMPHIVL